MSKSTQKWSKREFVKDLQGEALTGIYVNIQRELISYDEPYPVSGIIH